MIVAQCGSVSYNYARRATVFLFLLYMLCLRYNPPAKAAQLSGTATFAPNARTPQGIARIAASNPKPISIMRISDDH